MGRKVPPFIIAILLLTVLLTWIPSNAKEPTNEQISSYEKLSREISSVAKQKSATEKRSESLLLTIMIILFLTLPFVLWATIMKGLGRGHKD